MMEYLAFDFGDGTVCAARYNTELSGGPMELPIVGGVKELWSTLAKNLANHDYEVGVQAPRIGLDLELNWKSKPSQRGDKEWKTRRMLTVLFMKRVFDLFKNSCPGYEVDAKGNCTYGDRSVRWPCKIAIGVPCDWSDASSVTAGELSDVDEYKKMAKEAGLGDVFVFKESQAAVLYARKFMGDGLPDAYIEKGTLLIDVGSSTMDFTYLKGNKANNRGLTLGAKYVEQSLLYDAMKKSGGYEYYKKDASLESKIAAIQSRSWNLLETRGHKEMFFNMVTAARLQNTGELAQVMVYPLRGTNLQIGNKDGIITEDYVETCLNDSVKGVTFNLPHLSEKWAGSGLDKANTWRGHFRTALTHLGKVWKINPQEVTVVVTGGASRMQFIEEDVKGVWGKNVRYKRASASDQSFAVVKGLAWAGYVTDTIAEARKSVRKKIDLILEKEDAQNKIRELVHSIGDGVTDEVAKRLASVMARKPTSVNTKRKIAKFATDNARDILSSVRSNGLLNEKVKEVTKELLSTGEVKELFSDLQNEFGRSTIHARLPTSFVSDVNMPSLGDMNLNLDAMVNGIVFAIIYSACLYAGVSSGFGPAVLLTLGVAFILEKLLEKGPDDEIRTDKICKAATKIEGDKDKIRNQVYKALDNWNEGGYSWAISKCVRTIILEVKIQELNALEGLAKYRD